MHFYEGQENDTTNGPCPGLRNELFPFVLLVILRSSQALCNEKSNSILFLNI